MLFASTACSGRLRASPWRNSIGPTRTADSAFTPRDQRADDISRGMLDDVPCCIVPAALTARYVRHTFPSVPRQTPNVYGATNPACNHVQKGST